METSNFSNTIPAVALGMHLAGSLLIFLQAVRSLQEVSSNFS